MTANKAKLISYVLPVYNEEEGIGKFWEILSKEVEQKKGGYEFEFIFINDGSRDNSLAKLTQIARQDSRVKVINLSRNFGHQIAISAGIDLVAGDAVIIMDTDLQDRPGTSLELVKKWEEGYEVVFAQRRKRKDTFFKKLTAAAFYRVLEMLADVKIPRDTGDFRLIDRKVVEVLRKFTERDRFMRGIVASLGFKQIGVQFDRDERFAGKTNYPLKKMLKLAMDGIISFSSWPLQFIINLTIISFVATVLMFLVALVTGLMGWRGAPWFVIGTFGTLLSTVNLLGLSFIGQYIGRIYKEVQNRPLYIISEVIQF